MARFQRELERSPLPRELKDPVAERLREVVLLFSAIQTRSGRAAPSVEGIDVELGQAGASTQALALRWLGLWEALRRDGESAEFVDYWTEQCQPVADEVLRLSR